MADVYLFHVLSDEEQDKEEIENTKKSGMVFLNEDNDKLSLMNTTSTLFSQSINYMARPEEMNSHLGNQQGLEGNSHLVDEDSLNHRGYEDDDGTADDDDDLSHLNPLSRLLKWADSSNFYDKKMVARTIHETLRYVMESAEDVATVLDVMITLSTNEEPMLRTDLMEQVPQIAFLSHDYPRILGNIVTGILVPMVVRYLTDSCEQVRKTSQAALLVLLEQELVSHADVHNQVCPVILDLTEPDAMDDFKTEAVALMSKMAPLVGREMTKSLFVERFTRLCSDTLFQVRKVCAANFGDFSEVVGQTATESVLLPQFVCLCEDGIWGVRKACADVFIVLSCACSLETRREYLSPIFISLLSDQSRWVRIAAFQNLGPFISTFAELKDGDDGDNEESVSRFVVENDERESLTTQKPSIKITEKDIEDAIKIIEGIDMSLDADSTSRKNIAERRNLNTTCRSSENLNFIDAVVDDPKFNELNFWRLPLPDIDIPLEVVKTLQDSPSSPLHTPSLLSCDDTQTLVELEQLSSSLSENVYFDREIADSETLESSDIKNEISVEDNQHLISDTTQTSTNQYEDRIFTKDIDEYNIQTSEVEKQYSHLTSIDETAIDDAMKNEETKTISVDERNMNDDEDSRNFSIDENDEEHNRNLSIDEDDEEHNRNLSIDEDDEEHNRNLSIDENEEHNRNLSIDEDDEDSRKPSIDEDDDDDKVVFHSTSDESNADIFVLFENMTFPSLTSLTIPSNLLSKRPIQDSFPALNVNQDIVPNPLLEHYISMTDPMQAETVDNEITRHCAYSLPAVALTLGKTNWPVLKETYETLAADMHWKVRRTLAFSIHEMALILGEDLSQTDLLPVFEGFIKDLDEVRIGVLKHLSIFLKLLPQIHRDQFLPRLSEFLNPDNPHNWRFRLELALQLGPTSELYSAVNCWKFICPVTLVLMADKVMEIRRTCFAVVSKLASRLITQQDDECLLLPFAFKLHEKFAQSLTWRKRQSYVYLVGQIMQDDSLPLTLACSLFLNSFLDLAQDKVPNIRLAIAKIINSSILNKGFFHEENDIALRVTRVLEQLKRDEHRDVRYFAMYLNPGE